MTSRSKPNSTVAILSAALIVGGLAVSQWNSHCLLTTNDGPSSRSKDRLNNMENVVINKAPSQVHFVTFSNRLRSEECHSFRSLWMSGIPIHAVGVNGDFLNKNWGKNMTTKTDMKKAKVYAAYDYIQTLEKDSMIFFNDASDVIYVPNLNSTDVWNSFQEVNLKHGTNPSATVMFGAERNCWPFFLNERPRVPGAAKQRNKYPQSPTSYRYLNAGNWVAFRDPALRLLNRWKYDMDHNEQAIDDQHIAAMLYIDQTIPIILDFTHEVVGNDAFNLKKHFELKVDLDTGEVTNLETDTHPKILHFNGGKDGFQELEQEMYNHFHPNIDTRAFSNAVQESIKISGDKLLECFDKLGMPEP